MKFTAKIIRAEEVSYVKKNGEQSSYFELQFVHGSRPKTIYNEQTGQEEPLYTATGAPAMTDDVMTIQFWSKNDITYLNQCKMHFNLVNGQFVNIELHSSSYTNQLGRVETKWLAPLFEPAQMSAISAQQAQQAQQTQQAQQPQQPLQPAFPFQ